MFPLITLLCFMLHIIHFTNKKTQISSIFVINYLLIGVLVIYLLQDNYPNFHTLFECLVISYYKLYISSLLSHSIFLEGKNLYLEKTTSTRKKTYIQIKVTNLYVRTDLQKTTSTRKYMCVHALFLLCHQKLIDFSLRFLNWDI